MVFEYIFERIMIPIVSKYISGIDKKNLKIGIWNGNVVIQNVSL